MLNKKWLLGIIISITVVVLLITMTWNIGGNEPTVTEKASEEFHLDDNINSDVADGENKDEKQDKLDGKDKEVNESIALKEEGTKAEEQSTGTKPSATVKEEKKTEANKVETKTESKPQANKTPSTNNSTKPKESKPKDTVTTKTTTATESIAFKTVRQNDSSLEKGKEVVAQNGENGVKTITYKETYTNGKLTSKNEVSSKVTKNPVDKIVKVGTKAPKPAAPTYQTASQAHSILAGSGMSRVGNNYNLKIGAVTDLTVAVGGNHVTNITFNADNYIPWKHGTLKELQEILGKEEGKKEYDWGRAQAAKIEKAVRAAANAVYGSGTKQANDLYNQIIKTEGTSKSFK